MKKIIGSTCIILFFGFSAMSQASTEIVKADKEKTACCTPSEACAKKMGITLEECKALCKSKSLSETEVKSMMVSSDEIEVSKKSCCTSLEDCAKKMGMTIEECKAKCMSNMSSTNETKVASVLVSSDMNSEETVTTVPKQKCTTSSKSCCKKKQ